MRLSESLAFVPLFEPKDKGASAYVSDAVNLGLFHSFTAYLSFGAITADTVITVYADLTAALATALTTAIAFKYRLTAAEYKVALADQFGDAISVASTGLTAVAATFDHKTIAIEIDPDTLVGGANWVAINLSSVGNPLLVSGIGVGVSRYPGRLIPSAI
jgi:hypothetical protein